MSTWKCYISGCIESCTDTEIWTWRRYVESLLGAEHIIDVAGHDVDQEHKLSSYKIAADIVDYDLSRLMECQIVLCNPWKPSFGTSMELVYARNNVSYANGYKEDDPIPVVTIVSDVNNVSPWLRYHSSKLVSSIEEGCAVVRHMMHKSYSHWGRVLGS